MSARPAAFRLLVAALIALAAAAGCGGGGELSKARYEQEAAAVGDTLEVAFAGLSQEIESLQAGGVSSVADLAAFLGRMAGRIEATERALRAAADDLARLEPPEDVERAHDRLVTGLRFLADDMEAFGAAVRRGDTGAIEAAAKRLGDLGSLESGKLLAEATRELIGKGYDIRGNDR